jgi:hypothetical protein
MEMALGRVVNLRMVGDYGLKRVMRGGMLVEMVEIGMRGALGELGLGGW